MLKVLLEPKNSIIKQYQKLFLIEGIILEFQSSALKAVVQLALKKKAGARALRSVIEESLMRLCIVYLTWRMWNELLSQKMLFSMEKSQFMIQVKREKLLSFISAW